MPTALTAYLTSAASTTLSTANKLYVTSGTPTIVDNDTLIGTQTGWQELYSQGNASLQTPGGSIGSPSGHGFFLDASTLDGQVFPATVNGWSGAIRSGLKTTDTCTVTFVVRAYRYHSGTYTQIVSMTTSSQSFTTSSGVNISVPATTGTGGIIFATGDKLYIDVWANVTVAATLSTQKLRFDHLSTDTGTTTGDPLSEVVTPGYQLGGTLINKDISLRGKVSALGYHDVTLRGKLSARGYHDVTLRGNVGNTVYKFITVRGKVAALGYHDVTVRGRISALGYHDVTIRGNIIARNASGGFTLYGNGTGTVQYDSFRVTQYPDPSLSLAPITPRIGSTSASYNALIPTNTTLGVDTSLDGVNWTDVTSSNGGMIPGIFSQPDPTTDGFGTNSSANYTSTNRTGGAAGTWTYNTFNSRLVATGGTNALYLNSTINRADIDLFADLDQSDAGGLAWRYIDANNYYYLLINDTLSSSGTTNTITLYKVASNVQTQLGTAAISYSVGNAGNAYTVKFTRGTYRRFRVTMLKGVITAYVDGQALITYTDGSPLGAGLAGLYNNGGTVGSRYYQLWITPIGDVVTGSPSGDIVTGDFVYTRLRLATTDPTVTPQVQDLTTLGVTPDIAMGVSIPNITYNVSFLSANFDDLAKQSNYFWMVRPDGTFVFRAMSTIAAPWILQSGPAGLVSSVDIEVNSDLELDVGNDLYRNRQTILGAQDTITPNPAIFQGDGKTKSFTLGYILAVAPTIVLNGVTQKIGLKGTTGSNYYYALNDAVIEQDSAATVLQPTDTLIVTYTGLYDIVVVVDDIAEQTARQIIEGGTGIVEAVEDHSGEGLLRNAAITLASQLINRYALAGRTLIFSTSRNGLAVGQTLSIFFPEHGIIDGQFIITQIEINKLQKGIGDTQIYWYKTTCSELPHQASWSKLIATGLGLSG